MLARADLLVDQLGAMGTDGIVLGDRDVVLGLDTLRKLHARADFPFLVANMVDRETGEPVFDSRLVRDVAGMKVGIFGVTTEGAGRIRGQEEDPPWRIEDPVAVAKAQVEALEEAGAEVIVALAHVNDGTARKMAEEVPGISAILGGDQVSMNRHPTALGPLPLVHGHQKGKYLSILTLHVQNGRPVTRHFVDRFREEGLEDRIRRADSRIRSYERMLDRRQGEEAEEGDARRRGASAEVYKKQIARMRAEKQSLEMDLEDLDPVDPDAHYFRYVLEPIYERLEPRADIFEAVQAFRKAYPAED